MLKLLFCLRSISFQNEATSGFLQFINILSSLASPLSNVILIGPKATAAAGDHITMASSSVSCNTGTFIAVESDSADLDLRAQELNAIKMHIAACLQEKASDSMSVAMQMEHAVLSAIRDMRYCDMLALIVT